MNAVTIPEGLSRFAVPEAGLKFITHHALLFRSSILAEASDLFSRLLLCLHARQRRVAMYSADACAAVLVQVRG